MNLDELEGRFIRAAQRELAPSPADRERNEAQLLERLGPASRWGGSGGSGLGLSSRGARSLGSGALAGVLGSVRGSRVGMLGVGLIVGAVAGGWLGFGLGRRTVSSGAASVVEVPAALPASSPSPSELGTAAPPIGELPEAPALEPANAAPEEAAPVEAEAARRRVAAPARPNGTRRPPAAAQPESSLAVELAMLQRARRALNAENGRLALGIVHELDERFPKGVLIEERNATRILSLCQLERVGEAQQAAREFLARYPASVYAERVRQSCVAGASH